MTGSGRCGQCGGCASLRCGGCGLVHYCSKDHQKLHWSTHKEECWPVRIVTQEGKGRYLVASRDLKEGQLVMRESPVALGPTAESFPMCLGCHAMLPAPAPDQDMPRCPICSWPVCGPECAATDRHLAECSVLASDTKGIAQPTSYQQTPRYDIIMSLRCLLLQQTNPAAWEKVKGMESHIERRREDAEPHHEAAATYFTKKVSANCDEETIRHVHGTIITNAINTYGVQGQTMRGIYPTLYLMNHSCRPNVTLRSTVDSILFVRTSIPIKKGEPILFSYLPPSDPLWRRQQDLQNIYYFKCECDRCRDHTELGTYFSSPRCQKCYDGFLEPHDGPSVPWSCPECGEVMEAADVAREAENYVAGLKGRCTTLLQATEVLNDIINAFNVNHFVWMSAAQTVLREMTEMTQEAMSLRQDLWRRLINLFQRLEPGATRRKGVSLYNGAVVERQAATLHLAKDGINKPSLAFEEGLTRAVRMLDSAIQILELEPQESTEIRWLYNARREKQEIYDMIGAGPKEPN
ncbi:hypothetical protein Pmani_003097 [Petrolisthes manimaculis]|uniref:Uncharacterized protein n=1 Tax=Petrolisthes manimaculis TaxID=1843537 RepID=A0AAE1QH91_9EUCA|nr:hypothetical protein Pmani_003097 [Petrolisthes manimaculis]